MPNIAALLKEEIARVSRKELRNETEKLKKASAQYRSEIATLKRRIADLEKYVVQLNKLATRGKATATVEKEAPSKTRFSAKGLAAQRKRLRLSAADMGALIGVSAQTIYYWEAGKTRPRQGQLPAIAALRGVGKRQAMERLNQS